jgi:O-antigen/teichoic acid export membrane protein
MRTRQVNASSTGYDIVRRIGRGTVALSMGAAVNFIGTVAIVPIALGIWGPERYGEWLILTSAVGLLRLSDLGLQSFVVNRLGMSFAREERTEFLSTLHSSLRVHFLIAATLFALTAILVVTPGLRPSLELGTTPGPTVSWTVILMAGELLLMMPMGVVAGIYRVTGRLSRAAMIGVVQQVALLIGTLGLIGTNRSFAEVAAFRLLVSICIALWTVRDIKTLYPWIKLTPRFGSWSAGARMVPPSLLFLLIPLSDVLVNQFFIVVIGKIGSGEDAARFATHRTAFNLGVMFSTLLGAAVWPELTTLFARDRRGALNRALASFTKVNLWIVAALTLGLIPALSLFYPVWTSGSLQLDAAATICLATRTLLWAFWSPSLVFLASVNRHRIAAVSILASAVTSCGLAVLLFPSWGIAGAAAAPLIGDLLFAAWIIPVTAAHQLGMRGHWLFENLTVPAGVTVVLPILTGIAAWRVVPDGWPRYLVAAPTIACIWLALVLRNINTEERDIVRALWRQLRSRSENQSLAGLDPE